MVTKEKYDEDQNEYHSTSGNLMESQTSHLDDVLNEKLENAFHKQTYQVLLHDVAKIACEHSPIDLAHAVTRLPPSSRSIVYEHLPSFGAKVDFLINTDNTTRSAILRGLELQEVKLLVEAMPLDEAVWVLEDLSSRRLRAVLEIVDYKKAIAIKEVRKHDPNSAARLMTNEFFSFNMEVTIGEVSQVIRNNPGIDLTRRVFVTNDSGELLGFVPARNLIVNSSKLPIRQVMRPITYKVSPDASREEVVDIVERYKIPVLPVVDQCERLEGVITYEDVVEAMEDIADETIARMAGTTDSATLHDPIYKKFFARSPWLIVTLFAGMLNVMNMSYFESIAGQWFVFIVFFVPLITGMSGNVGLQCSTLLVRSIATGELSSGDKGRAMRRELMAGLSVGMGFGIFSGFLVMFLNMIGLYNSGGNPLTVSCIVAAGLFGACFTSSILGVISPFGFAKIGIDPAVASGPIVTAFNDVLSTAMYFVIARLLSTFLLF